MFVSRAHGSYWSATLKASVGLLALLVLLGSTVEQAHANLLVNGSFENGPDLGSAPFIDVPAGSTAIVGWTVGGSHIDYAGPGTWNISEGVRNIDLDGSEGSPPWNGAIAQTFATIPGQRYAVTFDLSGNAAGLPLLKQVEVTAGADVQVFTYDIGAVAPPVLPQTISYTPKTFIFTATENSTTLTFTSLTFQMGATGFGPIIDNVSATPALQGPCISGFRVTPFASVPDPRGVTVDSIGNIYTISRDEGILLRITPNGIVSTVVDLPDLTQGYVGPVFDPVSGDLFVSRHAFGAGNEVLRITIAGGVSVHASGIPAPSGLAVDNVGNVLVSSFTCVGAVYNITPDGMTTVFGSELCRPDGLEFGPGGGLFICNRGTNQIMHVPSSGGSAMVFASDFNNPIDLAFNNVGDLYVANFDTGTISKINPAGVVSPFGCGFTNPDGLAFDTSGNLFVADFGANQVFKVAEEVGSTCAEICDGLDNNCDGAVDENLGTTTCGIGACTRTVNNCVNGTPQTCSPGNPSPEACNGIDDNCNSVIDEGGDALCDDSNACTTDTCGGAAGCSHAPIPVPGPVGDTVQATHDQTTQVTTLVWSGIPSATHYNTYKGAIPSTMMGSQPVPYDHACHESDDAAGDGATLSADATVPPVGTAFYYLVDGENGCGEGSLGNASDATIRPNSLPCPTPP